MKSSNVNTVICHSLLFLTTGDEDNTFEEKKSRGTVCNAGIRNPTIPEEKKNRTAKNFPNGRGGVGTSGERKRLGIS